VIVIEFDDDAPKDRPWWFLLWEKADALATLDGRIDVPPTVDVPFLLHRDVAAGIDALTYPYGRGLRELALGMLVAFIPPEKQDGYRIADRERRALLEVCAERLGFGSVDHAAAGGAVSLSVWYDGSLVYRVARAMHELGLDTWTAGDRIPWPLDDRHGFDTEPIRLNPPGIVRGVPT